MNDSFFPTEDYKVPESPSNYMKLQDGQNNFRVLSSAIVGWEYWNKDNKPVRLHSQPETLPDDIRVDKGTPSKVKHFWAFVVWNYEAKMVQIFEVTQKSIMGMIKALVDNPKWGNPKNYDITITKTGEGLDTEYSVMPNPQSEIEPDVMLAQKAKPARLEALFDGSDPFA